MFPNFGLGHNGGPRFNDAELFDAQSALQFLTAQLEYVEPEVYQQRFPEFVYDQLLYIDRTAPEWAQTIVVYSSAQGAGQARLFHSRADDVPLVRTTRERAQETVHMAAIGYDYDLQELNQSRMLGIPIDADRALVARRAYFEFCELWALVGHTTLGTKGLINQTGVTTVTAPNGAGGSATWALKTPDEILADVNSALMGIYTGSSTVEMADTILLPTDQMQSIATRRLDATGQDTILTWLLRTNVLTINQGRPLTIRALRQLDGAGAGATDRMVAYRNARDVVKFREPMPHRFLEPMRVSPLVYEVPGIFRLAPVEVRLPKAMRYVDGI